MRPALFALLLLFAGCLSPQAPGPEGDPGPPDESEAQAAALVEPTFRAPLRLGHIDATGAEPSLSVAPDGTIYAGAPPLLWRSSDDGASFAALDVSGLEAYDGDVDFAVGRDGVVAYVGLDQGTSTPFQVSWDRGDSWSAPFDLADGRTTDRQWVDVLPDGTILATWRDQDESTDAILARSSRDGGASWASAVRVASDTIHGPVAHDPKSGAAYFAFYDGGLQVAATRDGGLTWTTTAVTREDRDLTLRGGRPIDMFPVTAVDGGGTVYLAWAADVPSEAPLGAKEATLSRVWLASSADGGATWAGPQAVSPDGKAGVFPWVVAGAAGRIALVWYEGRTGTPSHALPDAWDVHLVESADGGATFVGGMVNTDPVHLGAICRSGGGCSNEIVCVEDVDCLRMRECVENVCAGYDRSRAEYFEMGLTPQGHPVVVWVTDPATPGGVDLAFGGVAKGTPLA